MSEPVQKVEIVKQPWSPTFGCFAPVVSVFTIWALIVGLSTPWGVLHLDLFWPAIRVESVAPVASEAR